ncbi:tyrosine-type recombinase/integrase [Rummeliibacillus sp. TYF-LIM-RU47]|uniref:tyrosine-type recombinase/integrase n=1 Tax=Rummeliibacillus sp. TYF-LIM-RU47 TaxID=2608406 RepID=UPI001681A355|nr:tyrosine-type recombinase/integrase [Rummeliibacillus sp. TYF-LIM-RU47]
MKETTIKPYKLKNGDTRYMFKIYVGIDPLTGRQHSTTRRGFKKKREAELTYNRLKLEIYNGTYKKLQYETFQDLYNEWIVHYEKTVEESTFIKTLGIFKNHILPDMGSYRIEKINATVCQKHVDDWIKKLKGFRVVKSYAAKVIDFAIMRGYIISNPFSLVYMPKKRSLKKGKNYYTREQLIECLNAFKNTSNLKIYAFFRLLGFSGVRKGEALALTWGDIDFNKNSVNITNAISYGKYSNLYLKSTKTRDHREVMMDQKTMHILKLWKNEQAQKLKLLGFDIEGSQLVFNNTKNTFINPSTTRKWLLKIQNKYNLKHITTHGFRHTHATLLVEAGANLVGIQQRLGHSGNNTTTNTYTHHTENIKIETLKKYVDYIKY